MYSGKIYGLNGEKIEYIDPVRIEELNYIIPEGHNREIHIYYLNGNATKIFKYKENGTFRDIYNQAIVEWGIPLNSSILVAGR